MSAVEVPVPSLAPEEMVCKCGGGEVGEDGKEDGGEVRGGDAGDVKGQQVRGDEVAHGGGDWG